MKKLCLSFLICLCTAATLQAASVYADDYVYQKRLHMVVDNEEKTCQAFRIHPQWFATAAHCVDMCVFDRKRKCNIKILLVEGNAEGEVNVSAPVDRRDMFVPQEYRTVDAKQRVSTHKFWDVALIRFEDPQYQYEFADGRNATAEEFDEALKQFPELKEQWRGVVLPKIPTLYTYGGEELMQLKQNLIVPRWNEGGELELYSNPETVLYFGEKKSLWGADGFGVREGNSGGAVMLEDGGIIGIATAKMDNQLPTEVRAAFPKFGRAYEFFFFNGFAPKTTLKFIEQTMSGFGDRPRTQKLKRVKPVTPVEL